MIKCLKLTVCILLCVCVVVLNSPQSAQAALFTKNAEGAILAPNAEATEIAYVTPQTNAGTALFSTGTGFTSIGNDLLGRLQQVFQPTSVEQIVIPAAPSTVIVTDELIASDRSGIVAVPLVAEKAVVAVEDMIPVVPVEAIAMPPQAPAAGPATEEEKEKALFPLLWSGNGVAAAGAIADAETGAAAGIFSSTGGKVIGIGLLLAAVALGIILPLALSSGGSSGSGSSSGGDGAAGGDEFTGENDLIPGIVDLNDSDASEGDDLSDLGSDTNNGGSEGGSAPIPEPWTLLLFGTGLMGLFLRKRNA